MSDSGSKAKVVAIAILAVSSFFLMFLSLHFYNAHEMSGRENQKLQRELAQEKGKFATGQCGTEQIVPIEYVEPRTSEQLTEYAVAGRIVTKEQLRRYAFATDPLTGALVVRFSGKDSGSSSEVVMTRTK